MVLPAALTAIDSLQSQCSYIPVDIAYSGRSHIAAGHKGVEFIYPLPSAMGGDGDYLPQGDGGRS
jgi:hypothetical protein